MEVINSDVVFLRTFTKHFAVALRRLVHEENSKETKIPMYHGKK